jgi:DNA-binding CsgD family transcriptional regulator/PAS domain-containing protein
MAPEAESLIGAIYEAACHPQMWPDVLQDVSRMVGGASLYLCHVPITAPSTGYTWTHDFDPSCVAAYKRDYCGPHYSGVRACITQPVGILQDRRSLFDDESFSREPGHLALMGAQGLSDGVLAPAHRDRLTMSMFLCMRRKRHGALEEHAVGALQGLLPHIRRSLGIQQRMARLEGDARLVADALGSLALGVVIVASDMRLLFVNAEAERILALDDGLTRRAGRLVVADALAQAALHAEIARRAAGAPDGEAVALPVPRPSGEPALSAFVAPRGTRAFGGSHLPVHGVATIFLTDPTGPGGIPSAEALRRQFGLTRAEAEVARLVALGRGLPNTARDLGVSVNTARTHLRVVFEKLGVNQQAALAHLIARSFPAGVMEERDPAPNPAPRLRRDGSRYGKHHPNG